MVGSRSVPIGTPPIPEFPVLYQDASENSWGSHFGAETQPLRGRIREPRRSRLVDAAAIEEPLAHSAGHQLLDLRGRNSQPGGVLGPIFRDQRAGDIVAVPGALLDRVARR